MKPVRLKGMASAAALLTNVIVAALLSVTSGRAEIMGSGWHDCLPAPTFDSSDGWSTPNAPETGIRGPTAEPGSPLRGWAIDRDAPPSDRSVRPRSPEGIGFAPPDTSTIHRSGLNRDWSAAARRAPRPQPGHEFWVNDPWLPDYDSRHPISFDRNRAPLVGILDWMSDITCPADLCDSTRNFVKKYDLHYNYLEGDRNFEGYPARSTAGYGGPGRAHSKTLSVLSAYTAWLLQAVVNTFSSPVKAILVTVSFLLFCGLLDLLSRRRRP